MILGACRSCEFFYANREADPRAHYGQPFCTNPEGAVVTTGVCPNFLPATGRPRARGAYVASAFSRKEDVRRMQRLLRDAGYAITHDWTPADTYGIEPGEMLTQYLAKHAAEDMHGVLTADVLIVLHDDRGRGMACEVGMALAAGIPVIVVEARYSAGEWLGNVFYHLPGVEHVACPEDVLFELERLVSLGKIRKAA